MRAKNPFTVLVTAALVLVSSAVFPALPAKALDDKLTPGQAEGAAYLAAVSERADHPDYLQNAIDYAYLAQLHRENPGMDRAEATRKFLAMKSEWAKAADALGYDDLAKYKNQSEALGVAMRVLEAVGTATGVGPLEGAGAAGAEILGFVDRPFIESWKNDLDLETAYNRALRGDSSGALHGHARRLYAEAWHQCNNDSGQENFCTTADILVGRSTGVPLKGNLDDYASISPIVRLLLSQEGISEQVERLQQIHGSSYRGVKEVQVSLENLKKNLEDQFKQVHENIDALHKDLNAISDTQVQILKHLEAQVIRDLRAAEEEEKRNERERKHSEYQTRIAGARAAIFLLSSMIGFIDQRAGQQFEAVGMASIGLAVALVEFTTGAAALGEAGAALTLTAVASATALTAGVVGAALALFAAFAGTTAEDGVIAEVRRVHDEIIKLRSDMRLRLDQIDRRLAAIQDITIAQLNNINYGLRRLSQEAGSIRATLVALLQDVADWQTDERQRDYDAAVRPLLDAIDRAKTAAGDMTTAEFRELESLLYTWGTRTASDRAAIGGDSRPTDPSNLLKELQAPYAGNENYLQRAGAAAGITPLSQDRIPNMQQWSLASRAYARLLLENPAFADTVAPQRLQNLLDVGTDYSENLRNWSTDGHAATKALDFYLQQFELVRDWLGGIQQRYRSEVGVNPLSGAMLPLSNLPEGSRDLDLDVTVEAPWRPGRIGDCTPRTNFVNPVLLEMTDAEAIRFLPSEIRSARRISRVTEGSAASIDRRLTICFEAEWVDVVRKQLTKDQSLFLGKLQLDFVVAFEGTLMERVRVQTSNLRAYRLWGEYGTFPESVLLSVWQCSSPLTPEDCALDDPWGIGEVKLSGFDRAWLGDGYRYRTIERPCLQCGGSDPPSTQIAASFADLRVHFADRLQREIDEADDRAPLQGLSGAKLLAQQFMVLTLPNLPLRDELLRQALFGAGSIPDRDALVPLIRIIESEREMPADIREIPTLYEVLNLIGTLRAETSAYGQQIASGRSERNLSVSITNLILMQARRLIDAHRGQQAGAAMGSLVGHALAAESFCTEMPLVCPND
ncbi:hypothetical protein ACFC25_16810 [Pseudarthrobacter sp. NPDC055928]|uniref:hypothetical protein n=1 Tax=Pseudarthrobacter sp. NPDC055928 TaxID=3345661 RepID=UPI0035D9FCDD